MAKNKKEKLSWWNEMNMEIFNRFLNLLIKNYIEMNPWEFDKLSINKQK